MTDLGRQALTGMLEQARQHEPIAATLAVLLLYFRGEHPRIVTHQSEFGDGDGIAALQELADEYRHKGLLADGESLHVSLYQINTLTLATTRGETP